MESQFEEESFPVEAQGIDVLKPWGPEGPAPVGQWRTDVMGPDYQSRTIPLEPDIEGENVATLVRFSPAPEGTAHEGPLKQFANRLRLLSPKPTRGPRKFLLLYIHGRNDYFFQDETARALDGMGAAFYALDLRKYGRSLRPWQTIGYTGSLDVYDKEIGLAVALMKTEHPGLPLFVFGHSTGGLIATLWTWKHPDEVKGLLLNSAWLELQVSPAFRTALHQVARGVGQLRPHASIVGASKSDNYYRSLSEGWKDSGIPIPKYFADKPNDPALVGWPLYPEWKLPFSYPAPAAWVAAILDGQTTIQKRVHLSCPVLAMSSTHFAQEGEWNAKLFSSDVVLDAPLITARAALLSDYVTIRRFPGKHDLTLSDPPVREAMYQAIEDWLRDAFQAVLS